MARAAMLPGRASTSWAWRLLYEANDELTECEREDVVVGGLGAEYYFGKNRPSRRADRFSRKESLAQHH